MIPFNKPYLTGKETEYIQHAVQTGTLSGNGVYTKKCQSFFELEYGFKKCLLTTSCTDALEMCALLCDLQQGDEVIIPSYTFVSTALAFVRVGAKIVFADSMRRNPNLDADALESLITPRTRVIVPVHYAGVSCDMDAITSIAEKHNLIVVEDAAQAVDSYYKGHHLGTLGHLSAFSFHETKNIICGEGGMLGINDDRFIHRAEIIWEKGTNRAEFYRGEVNKYGWVDIGSSFLPSEVVAAFLWAQIENMESIQTHRKLLWQHYYDRLSPMAELGKFTLPDIPDYATHNAHMFYIVLADIIERSSFINYMKKKGVQTVFHYLGLHDSDYYKDKHDGRPLPECDRYTDTLVRLPLFFELTLSDVNLICDSVMRFFANR